MALPIPNPALDIKHEKLLSIINPEKLRNFIMMNNGQDFANILSTKAQVDSLIIKRSFTSKYYALILIATAITFNYILLFTKVSSVYHPMIVASIPIAVIFIFLIHRWRTIPNEKVWSGRLKHCSIIMIFLWLTAFSGANLLKYPNYKCTAA